MPMRRSTLLIVILLAFAPTALRAVRAADDPFKRAAEGVDDVDDAKPKPKAEKKPDALDQAAKNIPEPKPLPVNAGPCTTCLGTGYVPLASPPSYVRAEGESAKPAVAVPWKQCPKCKAGLDAQALLNAITQRNAFELKKEMEGKTGLKLSAVETRHLTLCGQNSSAELKDIGEKIEKLEAHLESITGSTLLTPCSPNEAAIYFLNDKASYETVLKKAFDAQADNLSFKLGNTSFNQNLITWPKSKVPRANIAVFDFAQLSLREVTDQKAPPWLREGFAAYCEKAVMDSNMNYSIAYEMNEVKLGKDWLADIRKYAADRKLRPWGEMFNIDMVGLGPLHYLTCYSMVRFLIQTDPKAFAKSVALIRDGEVSAPALEKAYRKKVDQLQNDWTAWCLNAH